jgi:hypothetical protein
MDEDVVCMSTAHAHAWFSDTLVRDYCEHMGGLSHAHEPPVSIR